MTSTVSGVNNRPYLTVLLQGLSEGMHARPPALGGSQQALKTGQHCYEVGRFPRLRQLDINRANT